MRILLINPPYRAVTSRRGTGEQIPLGLLSIGGPLLDDGHEVSLLDAEVQHLSIPALADWVSARRPDLIMTGHGGSTPAHPTVVRLARRLKRRLPRTPIVYGGVYPSYHGEEILAAEPSIDVIVRGEGERTAQLLARAYARGGRLAEVPGLILRVAGRIHATARAEMITDLNRYRVGWELIEDWDLYHCWGMGRAAVIQLSRGCPHTCTYCGQRGYWTRWRYRDPRKVASEIAWLHRKHGVSFVDLADENPTSSPRVWRQFLEALIAQRLPVKLFATIRAADIVRDRRILPLYKQAGMECVLMGIETTNAGTMKQIRKGSTRQKDYQAIQLLRRHRILSMVGYIAGFENERMADYWTTFRRLLHYDPDLLNAMYVTPHRWTPFYAQNASRRVVEEDPSKWDYRHQVLDTGSLKPWQTFLAVKTLEALIHLRPRFLYRLLRYPDREIRRALRWCTRNAARVWLDEIQEFLRRERVKGELKTLSAFGGPALEQPQNALQKRAALNTPQTSARSSKAPYFPQPGEPIRDTPLAEKIYQQREHYKNQVQPDRPALDIAPLQKARNPKTPSSVELGHAGDTGPEPETGQPLIIKAQTPCIFSGQGTRSHQAHAAAQDIDKLQ
ncbi:MAG: radical SAM protein [Candidatus Thiodiazotropha sp.]